jgi:hypothetical protein
MSTLADTYAKIRAKVIGDDKSPWYTRWIWWIVIAVAAVLVFTIWYFAKKSEARLKAAGITADAKAKAAETKALNARDRDDAAELEHEAKVARQKADMVLAKVEESSKKRKKLEASIKGASSWEELDALEKDIE